MKTKIRSVRKHNRMRREKNRRWSIATATWLFSNGDYAKDIAEVPMRGSLIRRIRRAKKAWEVSRG